MKFELYFNETNKSFRVLVNGVVHPLLCGFKNHSAAVVATQKLFPEFTKFRNIVHGDTHYGDDIDCDDSPSKIAIIAELERAISVVKGIPESKLFHVKMEIEIQFNTSGLDQKYHG